MCDKCEALNGALIFGAGWHKMSSAPKDGSTIEIEVRWGAMPWRGLFRWDGGQVRDIPACERIPGEDKTAQGWRGVPDANRGIISAYAWRPFKGDPTKYKDPYEGFDLFDYVILEKRPLVKLLAAEVLPWWKRTFQSLAAQWR